MVAGPKLFVDWFIQHLDRRQRIICRLHPKAVVANPCLVLDCPTIEQWHHLVSLHVEAVAALLRPQRCPCVLPPTRQTRGAVVALVDVGVTAPDDIMRCAEPAKSLAHLLPAHLRPVQGLQMGGREDQRRQAWRLDGGAQHVAPHERGLEGPPEGRRGEGRAAADKRVVALTFGLTPGELLEGRMLQADPPMVMRHLLQRHQVWGS
mmetsp:Transcript_4846/g.14579  ORF Transcript_4846/g.14579 Transcript_4846/m.14579 type:complete len:206 (+) Transcript_4846:194-811(+)